VLVKLLPGRRQPDSPAPVLLALIAKKPQITGPSMMVYGLFEQGTYCQFLECEVV